MRKAPQPDLRVLGMFLEERNVSLASGIWLDVSQGSDEMVGSLEEGCRKRKEYLQRPLWKHQKKFERGSSMKLGKG